MDLTEVMSNNADPSPVNSSEHQHVYLAGDSDIPVLVFMDVLLFVGLIGNFHAFFVYLLRYNQSVYRTFILFLAFVDFWTCVFEIPYYTLWYTNEFSSMSLCQSLLFLHITPSGASLLVLSLIAIDRYRRVCKPLTRQWSVKEIRIGLLLISALMVIHSGYGTTLHGPRLVTSFDLPRRRVGYRCGILHAETWAAFIYVLIPFITFVFGLIATSIVYMLIAKSLLQRKRKLNSMAQQGQHLGSNERLDSKATRTTWYEMDELSTDSETPVDDVKDRDDKNNENRCVSNCDKTNTSNPEKQRNKFKKSINRTIMFGIATLISFFGVLIFVVISIIRGLSEPEDSATMGFLNSMSRMYILNHVVNPYVYCLVNKKVLRECKLMYLQFFNKLRHLRK